MALVALGVWTDVGFGPLQVSDTMRLVIPSVTLVLLAFHIIYASFFISILDIRASAVPDPPSELVEPALAAAELMPRG